MKCPYCRHENKNGAEVCDYCKASLKQHTPDTKKDTKKEVTKNG